MTFVLCASLCIVLPTEKPQWVNITEHYLKLAKEGNGENERNVCDVDTPATDITHAQNEIR